MKIFLGEKTILLSDHPPSSTAGSNSVVKFSSKKQLKKIIPEFAKDSNASNLIIYSDTSEIGIRGGMTTSEYLKAPFPGKELLASFLGLFKIIEAAGGIVKNEKGDILFIFRRGKWDLPKGKISADRSGLNHLPGYAGNWTFPELVVPEKKKKTKTAIKESSEQAAIREVQEETGIHDIRIINELVTTYHIYNLRGKWILKPTMWFEMYAPEDQELIPEEKEDISEVRWINRNDLPVVEGNTYALIRELLSLVLRRTDRPGI
jgi:8-oxo-dGTP pyrophosphatase MutT (NUDIX family)